MDSLWYLNATTSGLPVGVKVGAVISSQWETQVLLPWVRKKNTSLWGYRGNSTTQFCGKYKIFTRKPINQQAQSACNNDFNVNLQGWRRRRWGDLAHQIHQCNFCMWPWQFSLDSLLSKAHPEFPRSMPFSRKVLWSWDISIWWTFPTTFLWGRYFLARAQRVSRTWAGLLQPTLLAVTNNQQLKLRLRGWLLEGQTQHRRVGAVAGQIHRGWRSWHLNVERFRGWSESWGEQPRGKELPKPDTDWSLQHFQQYRTFRLPALANASPKAMAWMKNGLYLWEAFLIFSLKKRLETAWHLQHPSFKVPERCIFFFFSRPFSSNFHMKNSPKSLADSFNHLWDGYHRIPRPTPRPAVRESQEIPELRDQGGCHTLQHSGDTCHKAFDWCFTQNFVAFWNLCDSFWSLLLILEYFDVYADSWFDASLFLKAVMDLVHF